MHTGRFPLLWFKKSLTTKDRLFLIQVSGVLVKMSYFKLCGIQIVKLLQMIELQQIHNGYNFTCQLELQKLMLFATVQTLSLWYCIKV